MQLTQIFAILAVAVAGVVAAPGQQGPPKNKPPPPPPPPPTSVVQKVLSLMPLYFASSNSVFRSTAVATPTRTAVLQIPGLRDIPAWVLLLRLLIATLLPSAATTTRV
jgi:hypothetical protein